MTKKSEATEHKWKASSLRLTNGVTAAHRASDWFVIRAATRRELHAEENLVEAGFGVYCPRLRSERKVKGRREPVERALFEGYLFAALGLKADGKPQSMKDLLAVDAVSGLVRLSRDRARPVALGDVARVLGWEHAGLFDRTRRAERAALFAAGERVRLTGGAFSGFEAVVVDMSPRQRVRLLVDLFGRSTPVEAEALDVRKVA